MQRIFIVLLGVVVAGLLGVTPGNAHSEIDADVVRIAEPRLVDNATASTMVNNVTMQAARITDLQRWKLDADATVNALRFVNLATDGCLSVWTGGTSPEGAVVIQERCINSDRNQLWRSIEQPDRTVRLVNVGSGRCLTIESFSTGQHPLLRQNTCGSQPYQSFVLVDSP